MPRRCVPTKDVAPLRKGWGRRAQPMIPPSPNGATPRSVDRDHRKVEGTGGTETSHVPRGRGSIPVVVASEPGEAQTVHVASRQALRGRGCRTAEVDCRRPLSTPTDP